MGDNCGFGPSSRTPLPYPVESPTEKRLESLQIKSVKKQLELILLSRCLTVGFDAESSIVVH